ncbi:type II secretion system protein [Paenibacillus sp. S150]|uniref:type II secretion system protein n=1 Tax=Paenibacillus sp. S150 TaxID=2749826 RepID=UPI001C59838A|nr:type II secretion system protein [Paenibacillus sp. S150]MBW4081631.1 type II secretion system protein [Paenibacillus sp. S150]
MLAQTIRKKLGKAAKEEKGFTLIELLAVIVILGIIAVIAIPMIGNVISNSRKEADLATARQLYDAARLYVIGEANGDYREHTKVTLTELKAGNYVDQNIVLPSTKAPLVEATTLINFNDDGTLLNVVLDPHAADITDGTYTATKILTE